MAHPEHNVIKLLFKSLPNAWLSIRYIIRNWTCRQDRKLRLNHSKRAPASTFASCWCNHVRNLCPLTLLIPNPSHLLYLPTLSLLSAARLGCGDNSAQRRQAETSQALCKYWAVDLCQPPNTHIRLQQTLAHLALPGYMYSTVLGERGEKGLCVPPHLHWLQPQPSSGVPQAALNGRKCPWWGYKRTTEPLEVQIADLWLK